MKLAKMKQRCQRVLFVLGILLLGSIELNAHLGERADWNHGLLIPKPEELERMESEWPQVLEVRLNKLGLGRVRKHLEEEGSLERSLTEELPIAKSLEEEIITNKNSSLRERKTFAAAPALPAYVDNSRLPSFPPIGDQGREGACVAFASTYYQTTHEVGLMNGYNNKLSTAGVLSPKWTYNMINGGYDSGSYPNDAYELLSQNGAVSIYNFPYRQGDYWVWDVKQQDWIDAMRNRTSAPMYIAGIGGNRQQDLTQIKQILNNGHVLTFATYANSWVFARVGKDPSPNASNRFVGHHAISWQNGTYGAHFVTIVGYDDDVWIDVNGNNRVDPGEKGAFLVANSWGTNWGTNGFVWVAYDAFLSTSAVANGPNWGRVPMAGGMNSLVISVTAKAYNYSPTLVAEFELNSSRRNQIGISAGVSNTATTNISRKIKSGALAYQGGPYPFAYGIENGGFALDLTDLADVNRPTDYRFYLVISDNSFGYPTTLSSFSLRDVKTNQKVSASNLPGVVDNRTIAPYLDYNFSVRPSADLTPPVTDITSPLEKAVVNGLVPVTISAKDDVVERVELYVDNKLITSDASAPYIFPLDTTKLTNDWHLLTAISYNGSNYKGYAYRYIRVQN